MAHLEGGPHDGLVLPTECDTITVGDTMVKVGDEWVSQSKRGYVYEATGGTFFRDGGYHVRMLYSKTVEMDC